MNDLNLIVKMTFGSHLYGTSTPDSDRDYKGIYLPTKKQLAKGSFPNCINYNTKSSGDTRKNTKEDTDLEVYSLHYFLELALQGETFALDMLHAPENMIEVSSPIWKLIQQNRSRFYTRNLNSFVGYARSQAAKYGIKGSRLNTVKEVIEFLKQFPVTTRMSEVWGNLPEVEHTSFEVDRMGIELYQVCGKKLQKTAQIKTVLPPLEKYFEQYGARAVQASNNEAIDWKAISHAFRACLQVKEILTTGDLVFPLKDADKLLKIKQGMLDFKTEVGPNLESSMEELEKIAAKSTLPETADKTFWEDFLFNLYF